MKRIILVVFSLLLLASCSSAEKEVNEAPQHMKVYYLDAKTGMLFGEEYDMPPKENIVELISSTIERMMQKHKNSELLSVFPENIKLLGVEFDHGTTRLNFSKEYLSLSGFDKTGAECAIALSLSNFWNVDTIDILVEGEIVTEGLKHENIITELPKEQD